MEPNTLDTPQEPLEQEVIPATADDFVTPEPTIPEPVAPESIAPTPANPEAEAPISAEADDCAAPKADAAEAPAPDGQVLRLRKRILHGALQFYALLLGFVLCALILLWCLTKPITSLLTQYEDSRPDYAAQEIFDAFFAEPDWALLYDMAGVQATEFEGREAYVTYMEATVGDQALDFVAVPATAVGEKRFSVRLNGQELAAFTILPVDDGVSTFQRWEFGQVELFFTREESVSVTLMPGYTVYINGIPLDDSYTVLRVTTAAENYLPEGLHGYRYIRQQVTGLLVQPEVTVLDENNNPVDLTWDPDTNSYTTPIATTTQITWGEQDLVRTTVETHALFAIRAATAGHMREYVSASSQAYEKITSSEALASGYASYTLEEADTEIRSFYRYSDSLFSVYAQATVTVTDKKGNTSSYTVGGTYFFSVGSTGQYTVTELYDVDLQQLIPEYAEG